MTDYYTENLADFSRYDIQNLRDILTEWIDNGLPKGFYDDGVKPTMNKNSGYVFLVNDEYQVAMLHCGALEIFHSLPYNGEEGFLADLILGTDPDSLNKEDCEYLIDAAQSQSFNLPENWQDYLDNR